MAHHSKDKVPKTIIEMHPQEYLNWIGKDYEAIECKNTVLHDSAGNEGVVDTLIMARKRGSPEMDESENPPFLHNTEIQSSPISRKILIRSHGYCNKASLQYGMPVEPFFISIAEEKSHRASVEIVKGKKFTPDVLSLTEMDADKCLNNITEKVRINGELTPDDFFDLTFLPFMTSKKHSQAKLYSLCLKISRQSVKDDDDRLGIRNLLDWYFEDLVKTHEEYEIVKGDLMNDIRARYIQDEKEASKKEGKIEGRIEGKIEGKKIGRIEGKIEGKTEEREEMITNILNEITDVNIIHKLTKCPLSEIIQIAESAEINIQI